MKKSPTLRAGGVAMGLVAAITLAACSSSDNSDDASASSVAPGQCTVKLATDVNGYPLSQCNAFGTTKLESEPKKIVSLTAVDTDILLSLGIVPTATELQSRMPNGIAPELAKAASDLGGSIDTKIDTTDGVPLEKVASLAPNAIVGTFWWNMSDDYGNLDKISPVITYPTADGDQSTTWEDKTRVVGAAMDRKSKAEQVIAKTDDAITNARNENSEFTGKTVTFAVVHSPSLISIQNYPGSNAEKFFHGLGFKDNPNLSDVTAKDAQQGIALENIGKLDADIVLLAYAARPDQANNRSTVESSAPFKALNAVKTGHYRELDASRAYSLAYPSPLGVQENVRVLVPTIAEAVKG